MNTRADKQNASQRRALARYPQGRPGKVLIVAAWAALVFGGWSLLPLLLLAAGLVDYDSAGAGMVALFFSLPALLLALGLFVVLQWRAAWASALGVFGLKLTLGSLTLGVLIYLSGTW